VVAYSGGVDSSVVLRVAHEVLGDAAIGVIGRSDSYALRELELALAQAAEFGAAIEVVPTGELADPVFASNTPDRCYHCKSELYRRLDEVASRFGARAILDGTIVDDMSDHRPGRRAAAERDVRSPLAELGFTAIDGLDMSPEMMQVAERRGVYRHFIVADLNQPLDMPDACYDGASCSGTFTHGHVDAGCLDELFRILRPGAPFAFTVKREVWEPLGFKGALARLVAAGRITEAALRLDRHYDSSEQPDGVFCVYRRT
jgi:SAM-dependent methyltransferase